MVSFLFMQVLQDGQDKSGVLLQQMSARDTRRVADICFLAPSAEM
jgi:hypothetical protein